MRFRVEQHFDASADEVLRALTNADYLHHGMAKIPDLGAPEVRRQDRSGDRLRQVVVYRFTGELPSMVTSFINPKRLTWIDDATLTFADRTATFTMTPEHYPSFFTCRGEWTVDPVAGGAGPGGRGSGGAGAGGSHRIITGTIKVSSPVPFTTGKIESAIVSGLEERLAHEPAVLAAWLAAHPA